MKTTDLKEDITESLESDLIAGAIEDYLTETGIQAWEEVQVEPPPPLSPKLDKRLARTVKKELDMQKPRRRLPGKGILIAAAILTGLAATQVSAIRSAIENYFVTVHEQSIEFSERQNLPELYGIDTEIPLPKAIPSGYSPAGFLPHEGLQGLLYTNRKQQEIRYVIYADHSTVKLDHENAGLLKRITINGQQGIYIKKDGLITLFWGKSPAYKIIGPERIETELFKMAESVELPKNWDSNKLLEDD